MSIDAREAADNCTEARKLLEQALAELGSIKAVADAIGVSRTAVSLVLSGKYAGNPAAIYARVVTKFGLIQCPYLGHRIDVTKCRSHCMSAPPVHNPAAMRHYKACLDCPNRRAGSRED